MPRKDLLKPRAGSPAQWQAAESAGPALVANEVALVDGQLVVGDGVNNVASLPVVGGATPLAVASLTTADLQARLDAAAAGSRRVLLGAGSLALTSRLFVPAGVTLAGVGSATVIQVPGDSPIVNDGEIADVTVNSLPVVTGITNLIPDPTFAAYPAGAIYTTSDDGAASLTVTRDVTGRGHAGKPALRFVQTQASQSDRVVITITGVTPGQVYTAAVWVETAPFTAPASHGGEARGVWFQTPTVAGSPAPGYARTLSASTSGVDLKILSVTVPAGEAVVAMSLYAPQGTTYWSDPVIYQGAPSVYLNSLTSQLFDGVLGGRLTRVVAGVNTVLRPSQRNWGTNSVAAKLGAIRDASRPLKVTIFGDSIADSTAASGWMKMISSATSDDPSLYLGAVSTYRPEESDWTNRAVGSSTSKLVAAHLAVRRQSYDFSSGFLGMGLLGPAQSPPKVAEMDLAILCVGQNGGQENNAMVDTCARLLRSAGVDVLLVATNPMNPAAENQGADRALAYRQIADAYDCGLADLNTEFRALVAKNQAGRPGGRPLADDGSGVVGLVSDTVHPSALGRKVYARVIRDQMTTARAGSRQLPPQMASPAEVVAQRAFWSHLPRVEFEPAPHATNTITREANSVASNPRTGWGEDLGQATNGAWVLPAQADYTANTLKFRTDGSAGVTLIVLGNGATQTFEVAGQNGVAGLGSVSLANSIAGRIYTAEIIPLSTTWSEHTLFVKSSTGGKILGALLYESGSSPMSRDQNTSVIPGLRLTGTWTLANFRVFQNGSGPAAWAGQLWGTDASTGSAEFDFVGTAAYARLGALGRAAGKYQVSVDGINIGAEIDGYNPNTEPAYLSARVAGLAPGRHTMRITLTGANGSAVASPAGTSRRAVIAQVGTWLDRPGGYGPA